MIYTSLYSSSYFNPHVNFRRKKILSRFRGVNCCVKPLIKLRTNPLLTNPPKIRTQIIHRDWTARKLPVNSSKGLSRCHPRSVLHPSSVLLLLPPVLQVVFAVWYYAHLFALCDFPVWFGTNVMLREFCSEYLELGFPYLDFVVPQMAMNVVCESNVPISYAMRSM